ncbi:MAG: glycosyltransferase family 2 protein [Cetobacterium sp.]|uniref:glycosyltransferase family 2 protein n=1 Tax=Cetobacterium sp. TaxID=2071632 RepID=UPI003F368CC8
MDNSICAVVVWYNPTKEMIENIKSYINFVDKVYIVDNSNLSNINLLENIDSKKCEYVSNLENLGIAKALNIACEKAIKEEYDWILTMDQDSWFEQDGLEKYFGIVNKKIKDVAIFCPVYKYTHNREILKTKKITLKEISKVITSGNLVNLDVYLKVGKYNEDFFIDQVDFEFCKKIEKQNKKIIEVGSIFLNHSLGDSEEKKFLGKKILITNHSPIRRYYMSRNILYMIKRYPELRLKYLVFMCLEFIKIIFFEKNVYIKIKYFRKGVLDFYCNKRNKFIELNIKKDKKC